MDATILTVLAVLAGGMMLVERAGAPVVLALNFKGDLKRESRWFAQYGQGACAVVVAMLLWRLDGRKLAHGLGTWVPVLTAVVVTGVVAVVIKRLVGRVRPGRELAGRFLGPTLKHESYRESFPSSHTASAVAMTFVLARLYPQAAAIFWTLAIICAVIRYLMDAHWPSDVLAGFTLGYAVAWGIVGIFEF